MMEVAFQVNPRQPHIEVVKHNAIRQAHSAEQFRLSDFKKTDVSAVEDYARSVDVAPADSIFDGVFLLLSQLRYLTRLVRRRRKSIKTNCERLSGFAK